MPRGAGAPSVLGIERWLALASLAAAAGEPVGGPSPQDLAAIVYTSGTPGRPKGVMLAHGKVLSNVDAVLRRIAPGDDDAFLSFLPLSLTLTLKRINLLARFGAAGDAMQAAVQRDRWPDLPCP